MTISNSVMSLFYQNINGARDKLGTLERLFSSYEIEYITEQLLSAYVSQVELSPNHTFFFGPPTWHLVVLLVA